LSNINILGLLQLQKSLHAMVTLW